MGSTSMSRRPDPRWPVSRVTNILNKLRSLIVEVPRTSWETVPVATQLDLVRLFSRIARKLGRETPAALRLKASIAIAELLNTLPAGKGDEHSRSLAAIRIDMLAMGASLPPMDAIDTPFAFDLRTIFSSRISSAETEVDADPIRQAQRTTLSTLFEAFERLETGPAEAVKLIHGLGLETLLGRFLDTAESLESVDPDLKAYDSILRRRYGQLLSRLSPTPLAWLETIAEPKKRLSLSPHLITHLSLSGFPLDALAIFHSLEGADEQLGRVARVRMLTALLIGLVRAAYHEDAAQISTLLEELVQLPKDRRRECPPLVICALLAVVKASAAVGRSDHVRTVLKKLEAAGWESAGLKTARLMRAAAQENDLETVREIFEQGIGKCTVQHRRGLWAELVRAYSRAGDLESAVEALDRMIKLGDHPSRPLLTNILAGYAARGAVEQAYIIFNRISTFNHSHNVVTFNTLVTLHANLGDPESVVRVMNTMRASNIAPDRFTWTTLMNARVRAGNFKKALRMYDHMQKHEDPAFRPDTAVLNVLLKASVLAGLPATSTLSAFRAALDNGIRPNVQTYTQVMHALSTAGLMDLAEELFTMMDGSGEMLPLPMQAVRPDAHVFSALIYGYIRVNETNKARACLREMRARGLAPTSVTYGIVVSLFLRQNDPAGLQMALQLAKDFLSEQPLRNSRRDFASRDRPLARGEELLTVFNPIIHSFAKKADADHALEYFKHVLHEGPTPSIVLHSSLLNAYRLAGDLVSVRVIWGHLRKLAMESFSSSKNPRKVTSSRANALCYPFTMYLETLTTHGLYDEIITTWKQLVEDGFVCDASNWNKLGVAVCQSGKIEFALAICEKLAQPDGVDFDPAVVPPEFGQATIINSSMETRTRLYEGRKREQTSQKRWPTTIVGLLQSPALSPIVQQPLLTHIFLGRGHFWFPHAGFLQALEVALQTIQDDPELRAAWVLKYPNAWGALRGLKIRTANKLRDGDPWKAFVTGGY